jgi:hypothetical protein
VSRWRRDDGAYAILYALLVVTLLGMASFVVDLGAVRADKREARSAADSAALAAAADLGLGPYTPNAACVTAWTFLWDTLDVGTPTSNPCGGFSASYLTCPTSPIVTTPFTFKDITVTFTWPVPSTSTQLSNPDGLTSGTRSYDPTFDGSVLGCDRFGVQLSHERTFGLASALGVTSGTSTAASVARKTVTPGSDELTYPLVVLHPTDCKVLSAGGTGATFYVANGGTSHPTIPGRIVVDSNGTTNCPGGPNGASILEVNGQNYIQTENGSQFASDPTQRGGIEVFSPTGSLPAKTTASGTLVPCNTSNPPTNTPCVGQTMTRPSRITRAPFDLAFKASVTQLNTALSGISSGSAGWTLITGAACGLPYAGTTAIGLNYYVNCPAEANNWKLSQQWSFPPGAKVLVNGDLVFGNGGCLITNRDPLLTVATLCAGTLTGLSATPTTSSILQVRGSIDAQGSGVILLPGTFVDLVGRTGNANPAVTGTSFTNVFWTAPYYADKTAAKTACSASATATFPAPQCFRNLAYWTETTTLNTIQGGASLTLEGTFFLGEAELKVGGNGTIAVTKSQFIASKITNGGTKQLRFVPDPERTTGAPKYGVALIR